MSGIDAPDASLYACACGNTCACRNTKRYVAPQPPNGTRSDCYICGCKPGEPHGEALPREADGAR
jgi:hypothetical protein